MDKKAQFGVKQILGFLIALIAIGTIISGVVFVIGRT